MHTTRKRNISRPLLAVTVAILSCLGLSAQQPGSIDPSFNSVDTGSGDVGAGADGPVEHILVKPDGKIVIAGRFSTWNGEPADRVAQLLADGSADPAFHCSALGEMDHPTAIALQADGKVIVAGATLPDGQIRVVRLGLNGTVDPGFTLWSGLSGLASTYVNALAVQPDGKVLVGGNFYTWPIVCQGLVRLNADGSRATDFVFGASFGGNVVGTITLQPDDMINVAGNFQIFNGSPVNNIRRLNANGTTDAAFDPGTGITGAYPSPRCAWLQADGKLVLGGSFTAYDGTARSGLLRVLPDGALDPTFDPGTGPTTSSGTAFIQAMAPGADGSFVVVGGFNSYAGTARNGIARILADGSLDSSFDPGGGPNGSLLAIAALPNGQYLIGGAFTSYAGTGRNRLARINGDPGIASGIAVRTIQKEDLQLFPNPNSGDRLQMVWSDQGTNNETAAVEILDACGRVVRSMDALQTILSQDERNSATMELGSDLRQGAYFVRLTVSGKSISRPLFIQP